VASKRQNKYGRSEESLEGSLLHPYGCPVNADRITNTDYGSVNMNKRLAALAAIICIVLTAVSLTLASNQQVKDPPMQAALAALNQAAVALQQAKPIYKGHRAAAINLTQQAIQEVKLGMKVAK
jgi:hypothetical protein